MHKQIPVREIHELELSSRCNLACKYCPHPKLEREKADMSYEIFVQSMRHVEYFVQQGTQTELSITGIGEAILHEQLDAALNVARHILQERPIVLATNGVAVTEEIADILVKWGVLVYVSTHRPEKAGPAFELLKRKGALGVGLNTAFVDNSLDWAGQVKWHVSAKRNKCDYLGQAWAVIRQDGSINTCCMDAHSKYPIAHVKDPLGSLMTRVTDLCASCHLQPPAELLEVA